MGPEEEVGNQQWWPVPVWLWGKFRTISQAMLRGGRLATGRLSQQGPGGS